MRVVAILLSSVVLLGTAGAADDRQAATLLDAREVFVEMRKAPDADIPEPLLRDCRCVAVFPGVVKGALAWGGRMGRGVISCRTALGWSAPSFMTMAGGSFGFQIGVEKADVVLFIMNDKGARSFLKNEFSLGAKGSVAAGPVGRSVEGATDLALDAEIYSYSRAKGAFAGVSLEGARVNSDRKAIRAFYGKPLEPTALLFEGVSPELPPAAKTFVEALP